MAEAEREIQTAVEKQQIKVALKWRTPSGETSTEEAVPAEEPGPARGSLVLRDLNPRLVDGRWLCPYYGCERRFVAKRLLREHVAAVHRPRVNRVPPPRTEESNVITHVLPGGSNPTISKRSLLKSPVETHISLESNGMFSNRSLLNRPLETHVLLESNRTSSDRSLLKKSLETHISSESNGIFSNRSLLKRPIETQISSESDETFSDRSLLKKSLETHISSESNGMFSNRSLLKKPIETHISSESNGMFSNRSLLKRPIETQISSESNGSLSNRSLLKRPIDKNISSESNRTLSNRSLLKRPTDKNISSESDETKRSKKTHIPIDSRADDSRRPSEKSPSGQFKCTFPSCNRSFQFRSHLVEHAKWHISYKPFRCDFPGCSKTFLTTSKLNRHSFVHAKEKGKFRCPLCKVIFTRRDHLALHILRHFPHVKLGFPCSFKGCFAKFSRKDSCTLHLKKAHRIEKDISVTANDGAKDSPELSAQNTPVASAEVPDEFADIAVEDLLQFQAPNPPVLYDASDLDLIDSLMHDIWTEDANIDSLLESDLFANDTNSNPLVCGDLAISADVSALANAAKPVEDVAVADFNDEALPGLESDDLDILNDYHDSVLNTISFDDF